MELPLERDLPTRISLLVAELKCFISDRGDLFFGHLP